ncbi:MAG: V-type ATP synthase subunit D [Candidatus Omnitrophica bacterium]|nr:V-type ATP synthase subunit D [Candidatus Omnitrophota bacterium]MCM8803477.1 V-type ATP synthase subunit D [Candidatus Omnitrophota bacterium]
MKIKVSPTRMELLKLKRRINIAKKGHKLLKDKEEQLLIEFRKLIAIVKKERDLIENEFIEFCKKVLLLRGILDEKKWKSFLKISFIEFDYKLNKRRIFNIPMNEIETNISGQFVFNYFLSPYQNFLIKEGIGILRKLFNLYEIENKLISFAEEIERTRRRVNALEYVLIPNIEEAIKYIQLKLDEYERSSLTTLKHLKLIQ